MNPSPQVDHGLSDEELAAGRALLRRYPSVDMHAHPGRFFLPPPEQRSPFMARYGEPFADSSVADMRAGAIAAVVFATVADNPVLGVLPGRLGATRPFDPGEAIADHHRQLAALSEVERRGRLRPGRSAGNILDGHAAGELVCVRSVEGGDFIEEKLHRLGEAHDQGVRLITIIHYRVNQIGDTQTEAAVHGGLSALGRDTVREMNRLGIIVDLAHATVEATRDAAEVTTRPMVISHSNLANGHAHKRLITREHARLVTDGGGVVGAVPAGFGGQERFSDYIDTLMRMTEALGVDHVAIGTDMDFTFQPVFTSYRDWPAIPGALLARGMHADEIGKLIGGNVLRVFAAAGD